MENTKPVRIAGQLFWSNWMKEFNTKFNEANDKYECTIGQLSDKAVVALEELGIKVKNKGDMGNYIVGKSKFVFEPVDEDGNAIDIANIGNGTQVVALVGSYKHKMSKMHGNAPSIKTKLIVTNLVRYSPEAKVEQQEEFDDVL